jgi:hypothetical protein
MVASRLRVGAGRLLLVALFSICIGEASCSGKEGTCAVADCGGVQPVGLGFTCEQYGAPPYATIVQTTVAGPCTFSCESPTATGECALVELGPTGPGECDVAVTSSTGEVFSLTYTWVSRQIMASGHLCPGCFTLDLADGGPSPSPFARECDGGVEQGANDGG